MTVPTKHKTGIKRYHLHKDHPEKLQFEIFCLSDYLAENKGHSDTPHIHGFYQIIWFSEGKGKHFVDFNEHDVVENSIFFIPKGQIHYFDENLNEGYIIHFNEEFLADDGNEVNIFLKHNIFNSFESEPFFRITKDKADEFHNLLSLMQHEMCTPKQFAHKDYLKHLLNLFLILVQRLGVRNKCKNLSIHNPHHIVYVKFRQLLEANYRNIHTVNEYAGLLNISPKTLTNYTKEVSFQTPLEIINERITLEAKRLLLHSGHNINEIGFRLGFEDPSYFVKFFKKHTRNSPGQFRHLVLQ